MNLIVGLGKTGFSIAQYFIRKNIAFHVLEENKDSENLKLLKTIVVFHELTPEQLQNYDSIYLSPGINPNAPLYQFVQNKLSNDLNIFTQQVKKPYLTVTGSNGKTTLVHLLEIALGSAGYSAIAIGNNGVPMLDHLDDKVDYFILELSSYQLELAQPFLCEVAYVSNISQDHLERHGSMERYVSIKEKLYQNCRCAVVNDDDIFCRNMKICTDKKNFITIKQAASLPALKMLGQHNRHNVLAVLSICRLLRIDISRILEPIANFPGLEHRCEFIVEKNGVTWWNDSKGTNVDSALTAIRSVLEIISGKLVIILGGQGKGQDFSPLVDALKNKIRLIILMGENKHDLYTLFDQKLGPCLSADKNIVIVEDLINAVKVARVISESGDAVLLSPACASLDMFKSYEDRGRQFKALVQQWIQ